MYLFGGLLVDNLHVRIKIIHIIDLFSRHDLSRNKFVQIIEIVFDFLNVLRFCLFSIPYDYQRLFRFVLLQWLLVCMLSSKSRRLTPVKLRI